MGDDSKPPSPWRPETDLLMLAVLGKLLEELGECVSIVSRCIIQGVEEDSLDDCKPNRRALEEEIADVKMSFDHAIDHLGLDEDFIARRRRVKYAHKQAWHDMIRRGEV